MQFTATDLQSGNASKGLSGGVGANVGDARLAIETDLHIVPLAFVRAADGTLTLAAGGAQTLTAQQLEAGDTAITGQLGAGTGKWRLTVTSDQPLQVVNIVAATAGYWNSLSTTAAPGAAPADLEALNERFVGNAVVYVTGSNRFTLDAQTGERFTETAEIDGVATTYMGSYGYAGIGPDAGRLTLTYDDGTTIALNNGGYFELSDGTRYTCTSTDGFAVANGTVTRGTVPGRAAGSGEVDRFPSFRTASNPGDQTYTVGTAIDALTLPEASGGNGTLAYSLSPDVPGLSFDATARQLTGTPSTASTYAMTYTVADDDGDTDTLSFTIAVEDSEDHGDATGSSYGVGDALPGVPTGFFFPARLSGGVSVVGTTITFGLGGSIELNDGTRYTCTSPDGCTVVNGTVTRGTLVGGDSSDSFAPADEQSFNSLAVGNRFHGTGFYMDFVSAGRFTESGSLPGSYTYASTGSNTGTLTQTYDGGQYGGSCTVLLTFVSETTGTYSYTCASAAPGQGSWTITSTDVPPAPRVTPGSGTNTELDVRFLDAFEAGESRAYDYQFRRKAAGAAWGSTYCRVFTNNSNSAVSGVVTQTAEGFQPATVYQVRYRYRNSGSCDSGSPGNWSWIGEGRTGGAGQGLGFSESGSAIRPIPENLPGGINVGVPVSVADDAGNRESIDVTIDLLDLAPR